MAQHEFTGGDERFPATRWSVIAGVRSEDGGSASERWAHCARRTGSPFTNMCACDWHACTDGTGSLSCWWLRTYSCAWFCSWFWTV